MTTSEGSAIAIGFCLGVCICVLGPIFVDWWNSRSKPSALASEQTRPVEHGPTPDKRSEGFDNHLKRVYLLCAMRAILRTDSLEDAKEIAKAAVAEGEKGL